LKALSAVDRLVAARLERHFGRTSAAAACRTEHLALTTAVEARTAPSAAAFCGFAGGSAVRASAGFVLETLLSVELLLAGSERELLSAVDASDKLIGIHLG
jgi:hypothetical protein